MPPRSILTPMRTGLLCLLFLVTALPAAAWSEPGSQASDRHIRPPYYSCAVQREVSYGTVRIFKLIEPSGRGRDDHRLGSWDTNLSPDGIQLHTWWSDAPSAESGFVDIFYPMADSEGLYRIQVQRFAFERREHADVLQWETGLEHPVGGALRAWGTWGVFLGLLAGAPDPRIAVLRSDDTVLHSDPVDLTAFPRAAALAESLAPELDAMVADYRHRCELIETLAPPHIDVSVP